MPKVSKCLLKCYICGTDKSPHWHRNYNDKGDWTGRRICSECKLEIEKEKTRKIKERFSQEKICCRCRSIETYVDPNGYHRWHRHVCDKKSCTKFLCDKCWNKVEYNADWRDGNLDPESPPGKGFATEMTVAKVRNLKNCNLELDNFNAKFDLSIDPEYGKPQVKGPTLIAGMWHAVMGIRHNFDHLWIVCMDKKREHVKRVYIIPKLELINYTHIDIYEDWSRVKGGSKFEWIEKYRVDEKPYDDAYHDLKLDNCNVLRKNE